MEEVILISQIHILGLLNSASANSMMCVFYTPIALYYR